MQASAVWATRCDLRSRLRHRPAAARPDRLGRLSRAEEVANAALFLASDQSSYMTRAHLMNDGSVDQV